MNPNFRNFALWVIIFLLVVALGRKAFPELYAVETLEPPRR